MNSNTFLSKQGDLLLMNGNELRRNPSMKRLGTDVLILALSAAVVLSLASCGGSHSDNRTNLSTVSTSAQGAQAATAGIKTARSVQVIGSALAMITSAATSSGTGLPLAPAINAPSGTTNTAALTRFSTVFSPALGKTMDLRSAALTFPATIDCATNTTVTGGSVTTPDSVTIVGSGIGPYTVTFNGCREGAVQVDGVMTATLTGVIAAALTLGTVADPLTVTKYADASSPSVSDVLKTTSSISFSQSGAIDTFAATGSFENWDYVAHGHEKLVMTNLAIAVTTGTTTVGGADYRVDTFTVNGPTTGTVYLSDTDSTINYTESASYSNFLIVDKSPVAGSPNFDYLTLNGTFSISTAPADKCIDGTFSIVTNTEVKIDNATETTVEGQLSINGTAVAVFNADGSLTVTANGGTPETFSESELAALCPL
jgi:hypothetical protein